jgi:hypothetical protein
METARQDHSSPPNGGQTPLPNGITEADLVDGPRVVPLPSGRATLLAPDLTKPIPSPPPEPSPTSQVKSEYPELVTLALDVLSARLLGLISLVAACLIWAGVVWDPQMWRIVAAGVFSVTVFLPIMAIYWRSGMKGEES